MKTLFAIILLAATVANGRIMSGGYWPAPRNVTAGPSYWTDPYSPSTVLLFFDTNTASFLDNVGGNHFIRSGAGQSQAIAGTNEYGRVEYCAEFDGTPARLYTTNQTTGLSATNDFTLITYAYFTLQSPTKDDVVYSRYQSGAGNPRWAIWREVGRPGTAEWYLGDNNGQPTVFVTFGNVSVSNWHGLAIERSNLTFRTYLDGSFVTSRTDTAVRSLGTATNVIGLIQSSAYQMQGRVGNTIIYNHRLGADAIYEVTYRYYPTNSSYARTTPPSAGWWVETNQYALLLRSWNTNTSSVWFDETANAYSITGQPSAGRYAASTENGAKQLYQYSTYMTVPTATNWLSGVSNLTMCGWFYRVSDTLDDSPLYSIRNIGGSLLALSPKAGGTSIRAYFPVSDSSSYSVASPSIAPLSSWISIVATYSNGAMSIYTNGILSVSSNRAPSALYSNRPLILGSDAYDLAARSMRGYSDWVGILTNTAWSSNQVYEWHSGTPPNTTVP